MSAETVNVGSRVKLSGFGFIDEIRSGFDRGETARRRGTVLAIEVLEKTRDKLFLVEWDLAPAGNPTYKTEQIHECRIVEVSENA